MTAFEIALITIGSTWAMAILALLYKIGLQVGTGVQRLNDLERRAEAWDVALAEGYRPRPPRKGP